MKNQKEIIGAFLAEKMGDALTEDVLNAINKCVTLEAGNSNEANETRSIKLKENTEGKVDATSFKLYNIMKLNWSDWADLVISGAGVFIDKDTKVKIGYALFQLIFSFVKKLKYEFSEFDAKVLLQIHETKQSGKTSFSPSDILAMLEADNTPSVNLEKVEKSFAFLKDMRVLRYLGDSLYELKERINYERI